MATEASSAVKKSSRVELLVNQFMARVTEVAESDDWLESDGWLGRIILLEEDGRQVYTYAINKGKLETVTSQGPFVATITMGIDSFLDLIDSALSGQVACPTCNRPVARNRVCSSCQERVPEWADGWAERVFENKYRLGLPRGIRYEGDRWIVDSERFRKVFKRMGRS